MSDALPTPHLYRLAPILAARFVGAALLALAVVTLAVTAVVGAAGWAPDLIILVVALGLVGVLTLGWWLRARAWVLRCDEEGYAVRLVRGAGTRAARWKDVAEAATATPAGTPCLVLRLHDGATTTIPVEALAVDREQFVREMQRRLAAGQGLRPLS
jgi:hypothetical protein